MEEQTNRHHSLWDYNIIEKLGQGQQGVVYKVKHRITNKIFALKKINLSTMSESERAGAYQQIKNLQKINHQNLLQYYECYLSLENLYIISEYAQKGSIATQIQQRRALNNRYKDQQLLEIFEILASAIKTLHQNKIIHRNIKLENIFLTKSNTIKLGDLGLSKLVDNKAKNPLYRIGTPIYFAPELIQHQHYSFEIDIWALGCVFYTLVNLTHPFQGATLETLAYAVLQKGPKPLKYEYNTKIVKLIFEMLHKNSKNRPIISKVITMIQQATKVENFNRVNIYNRNLIATISNESENRKTKTIATSKQKTENIKAATIATDSFKNLRFSSLIRNKSLNESIEFPENPEKVNTQYKLNELLKTVMHKKYHDIHIQPTKRKLSESKTQSFYSPLTGTTIIKSSGFQDKMTLQTLTERYRSQGNPLLQKKIVSPFI